MWIKMNENDNRITKFKIVILKVVIKKILMEDNQFFLQFFFDILFLFSFKSISSRHWYYSHCQKVNLKFNMHSFFNMEHKNQEVLSAPMTIVAMINGMIGGLILLLPVYALNAGYLLTLIIIIFTGVFSYYSCYLCLLHLGDHPDLDYAILRHFNGERWVKISYDLCVWLCLIFFCMFYFQLIIFQWQGLIPPHQFSPINPILNAVAILSFVLLLKYFQFGANIMSFGIISILSYLIFLIFVINTDKVEDKTTQYEAAGSGALNLAAAMGAAFSIQLFFIPILKKNSHAQKYTFFTILTYIFGCFAYYYIAYIGSFGIWHRTYVAEKGSQRTIEGYFESGSWQVSLIQAIYLIHLYSVFPEFLIISKKRMFGVLNLKQSGKGAIKITEVLYFSVMILICLLIGFFELDIKIIVDLGGGVLGFFFIYFIPAALHVKCLYFSKGKRPIPAPSTLLSQTSKQISAQDQSQTKKSSIQIVEGNFSKKNKGQIFQNHEKKVIYQTQKEKQLVEAYLALTNKKKKVQERRIQIEAVEMKEGIEAPLNVEAKEENNDMIKQQQKQNSYFYCNCELESYSSKALIIDWIFLTIMVGLGLFILFNGIYTVAIQSSQ